MINFPEVEIARIGVKLRPKAEKLVKKGHPWVFSDSIIKQNSEGNSGDLAIMFDSKSNKFMGVGLLDPGSPIRIKVLAANKAATIDEAWFEEKIKSARKLRNPLVNKSTNAYRLIFGENDGLPGLIADVYDHVLVVKLYSDIWIPYLKWIIPLLKKYSQAEVGVLRLSRTNNASFNAHRLKDGDVLFGELDSEEVHFVEHDVHFSANVIKGHKTGYFLDHRANRKRIGELASKMSVLDVFSYAGGFSVHALAGGAKSVVSLDISKQALQVAEYNASLNKYSGSYDTRAGDAFVELEKLKTEGRKFDIVVIDPPSFAKSKNEIPRALKSYRALASMGVKLVADGGLLLLASCSSRIDEESFFKINEEELDATGRYYQIEKKAYHDIDHPITFPEGAYLKAGYYRFFD